MQRMDSPPMFGARLRYLRNKSGITAAELCKQYNERFGTSLTRNTVSRYENAVQLPLIDTVQRLAEFFDVSQSYLVGATDVLECYNPQNGYRHGLSEEESELLRIYSKLDVKSRHKLMALAFSLEEELLQR